MNAEEQYNVMWRSGYNVFKSASSVYRYAYGSSYESDQRLTPGLNIQLGAHYGLSMLTATMAIGLASIMIFF